MNAVLLDEFGIGDAQARAESWRYSRNALRALEREAFAPADPHAPLADELCARFDWAETRGSRLVFVNGALHAAASDLGAAAAASVVHAAPDRVRIELDAATPLLHLVYVSLPAMAASRWRATLDLHVRGGQAQIVEQHLGAIGAATLGVLHSRLAVDAGAHMHLTTLCDLADAQSLYRRSQVSVAQDGACTTLHALFGGRLQRHDIDLRLAGARARHEARGVFALRGREHVDVHLDVHHAARDALSDIAWRGVADQRARGILHGAIAVEAGADGADARLQTKNLLLSQHAEIDAQPVLEIHADEVKASHGATVGQLDERALFYLRSRGLPLAQARALLIGGFCREMFYTVAAAALRARLDAALGQRLPHYEDDRP